MSSVGKHQNSLKSELISLQLATARLARKHHNFTLTQRLLLKQVSLLGSPVKISPDLNCNKKQFLERLMESLNDASLTSAKPVDVMQIQRECSKLAFAFGHNSEAVYFLSDSISQYSNLGDIDSNVGELNSRSLLTLAKWFLNDRKLLTAATKVNGNGLSVAMKINSLCDLETSYVSLGHSTLIPLLDDATETSLNANTIPSVASGVTDTESVCGQLLHLATMQSPDLGKAWFNLAGWCYRWGRKTVEQARCVSDLKKFTIVTDIHNVDFMLHEMTFYFCHIVTIIPFIDNIKRQNNTLPYYYYYYYYHYHYYINNYTKNFITVTSKLRTQ